MLKGAKRLLETPCISLAILAINRGWAIKPTAKSDTARLDSNEPAGECKEDVLQIAIRVTKFPSNAVGHRRIFTTQMMISENISCPESPEVLCNLCQ